MGRAEVLWQRVGCGAGPCPPFGPFTDFVLRRAGASPAPYSRNKAKMPRARLHRYFTWLCPVLRRLAPAYVSTVQELGRAMLAAARVGYPKPILEVRDIVALAHASTPAATHE